MVYFKGSIEAFLFSKSKYHQTSEAKAYYPAASQFVNTCTLFPSALYTNPHTFHFLSPIELLLFMYCSQIDPHYMLLIYLQKRTLMDALYQSTNLHISFLLRPVACYK